MTTVCAPLVAPYSIVPPQVFPVGIGVDVVFDVLIVPALPDAVVTAEITLVPILSVPPEVVFNVVMERSPFAVSVLELLSNVSVVYVPAGTY